MSIALLLWAVKLQQTLHSFHYSNLRLSLVDCEAEGGAWRGLCWRVELWWQCMSNMVLGEGRSCEWKERKVKTCNGWMNERLWGRRRWDMSGVKVAHRWKQECFHMFSAAAASFRKCAQLLRSVINVSHELWYGCFESLVSNLMIFWSAVLPQ